MCIFSARSVAGMGCCISSEAAVPQPPSQESLLVAEHPAKTSGKEPASIKAGPADNSIGTAASGERPKPVAEPGAHPPSPPQYETSPIPLSGKPADGTPSFKETAMNTMSPGNSSTSSWDGEGAGIWRVCNGDISPNPLTSIMEEKNAEEEEAREAAGLGATTTPATDGNSPFFRSVASAETSPAVNTGNVPKVVGHGGTPGVLSSIMQEKAANGGNISRNPMIDNHSLSPPIEGSPFFRSVSSVDGGTPGDKEHDSKNNPLALGFDVDDGHVWRDSEGVHGAENCPPVS